MSTLERPLICVHGLWDKPYIFNKLFSYLENSRHFLYAPYLDHAYGRTAIKALSIDFERKINDKYGPLVEIDLLGFSMGGLISRFWLQELGGYKRTKRFFCIGSPQHGTFTAQCIPRFLFEGISDMKLGSDFIHSLKGNSFRLEAIHCESFYCKYDLMVFPGWTAVLPFGSCKELPALTHKSLIYDSKSLQVITDSILL